MFAFRLGLHSPTSGARLVRRTKNFVSGIVQPASAQLVGAALPNYGALEEWATMFMRPLLLALVCTTVLSAVPASGGAQTAPRTLRPIGSGAQFVAPNAALYLALDRDPAGEQARILDRFTSIYAGAREIEDVRSMASSMLGLSFDEVVQGTDAWVGGEVFLTASTYNDFSGFASPGSSIDLDCSVPGFLIGASIGDLAAFQRFMSTVNSRLEASGLRTGSENHNGVDVFFAGRSPEPGGGVYMAIHRGYALLSPSRDRLFEAIDREPQASLASSSAFQSALARFPEQQLAFFFAGNQPTPFGGRSPVAWQAGALRLMPDSVRLDVAQSLIPDALGPATRSLLEKAPNPLRAAGAAPAGTALFIGWDNLRLLWNQIVEVAWPNPDQYARVRADFAQSSGLDLEDDVFGWMTGEAGIFITPAADQQGALTGIGFGLLVEAKDRTVGRQKLDKIMDAIRRAALPSAQATTETVDDASFTRIPVDRDTALYGGLVDQWVVFTSARSVAAGTVAATKGRGSLASQPEYGFVRSRLGERQQFLFFAAPPSLAEMITSAARAAGGQVDDITPYVRPIPSVALGVDFTVNSIDTRYVAHVAVPDQPIALPTRPATAPRPTQGFRTPLTVLVDASKHGGAWWADDEEPSPVTVPKRAQALEQFAARNAIFLRPIAISPELRVGRQVRGSFDPEVIEPRERVILRVGSEGAYLPDEIAAYQSYVRCGGTVILLSDAKEPGTTDELAAAFGMEVAGRAARATTSVPTAGGGPTLDSYVDHPVTDGATSLAMDDGTGLVDWDDWTRPLGFLSEDSYLDLDGNGRPDADEPFAAPALAIRTYGKGTVVFLGTTNILDQPEHPLFGQLLRYLFPDTAAPSRGERDDPSVGRDESVDGGAQLLDFEWLLDKALGIEVPGVSFSIPRRGHN